MTHKEKYNSLVSLLLHLENSIRPLIEKRSVSVVPVLEYTMLEYAGFPVIACKINDLIGEYTFDFQMEIRINRLHAALHTAITKEISIYYRTLQFR